MKGWKGIHQTYKYQALSTLENEAKHVTQSHWGTFGAGFKQGPSEIPSSFFLACRSDQQGTFELVGVFTVCARSFLEALEPIRQTCYERAT